MRSEGLIGVPTDSAGSLAGSIGKPDGPEPGGAEPVSQSQVPPVAARYFGWEGEHPIITRVYWERGWRLYPIRKYVSKSWCRKLRAEGALYVELHANGRYADFSIKELCRAS